MECTGSRVSPKAECCFVLLSGLLTVTHAGAQGTRNPLTAYEDTLKKIAPVILNGRNEIEKYAANEVFIRVFEKALLTEGSYTYPFDSLVTIARLKAPDGKFYLFCWNLPRADGTLEHFGYIFPKPQKKVKTYKTNAGSIPFFRLYDHSDECIDPEHISLPPDRWWGAHFYDIILGKKGRKRYYTLLGWDGNNRLTTKKIIDVLSFNENGMPGFGTPVLESKTGLKHRIVFEYSSQAVMSLRYDREKKLIIFDHLSPSQPHYEGIYEFYGPDGSYDAFEFKKGRWKLIEDVDARNSREQEKKLKPKPYNQPE